MAKRLSILIILTALLVMTLAASFITPTTAQTTRDDLMGELRLVNGLVGLGPVDVYLNDQLLAYGLAPEAATTYFSKIAGRYSVAVRPAGADPYSVPIADMLIDLMQGQSLTAIAYQKQFATEGYIPPYQQAGAIYVMTDDRSPIQLGKTRLTAVHLAVGAADAITVGYPRAALLDNISLEMPFGGVDSNSGLYSLTLMDAKSATMNVLERFGDQSFYANTLYTLVIVPNLTHTLSPLTQQPIVTANSPQPHLFIVTAPTQPPDSGMRLRLINTAYSIPSLDVYIDGQLTAARMNYSSITEYLGIPGYQHNITLRRAGAKSDSQPLAETTFAIAADSQPQQYWTLLLVNGNVVNEAAIQQVETADTTLPTLNNTPNSPVIMTLLPDNLSQTAAQQARLRLLHAVDSLPPIRLFSPDTVIYDAMPGVVATPTVTPIPAANAQLVSLVNQSLFGATAGETEVRTGIYNELNLQLVGNGNDIQTLPAIHFVPELVYTYVVMGSPSGNPPIQVVTVTDFGRGLPFFRPGQLPTPTTAPIVVTRIPRTPTPGEPSTGQPTAAPQNNGGQSSGGNNGGGNNGGGNGGGGGSNPPASTSVPPSPIPPTFVPPTSVPPTAVPPTNPPPPPPTDPPPPPPTDPPPPPPTDPPPDDGGILPPILKTLLPPLGGL
jgi:hypothetical protein